MSKDMEELYAANRAASRLGVTLESTSAEMRDAAERLIAEIPVPDGQPPLDLDAVIAYLRGGAAQNHRAEVRTEMVRPSSDAFCNADHPLFGASSRGTYLTDDFADRLMDLLKVDPAVRYAVDPEIGAREVIGLDGRVLLIDLGDDTPVQIFCVPDGMVAQPGTAYDKTFALMPCDANAAMVLRLVGEGTVR